MKINTKVRYGLKALAYIAENISVQYLEQILFKLKNENIIEGKRGPTGGYKLAIEPKEIDLYMIYKILDDEEKVIDCNEMGEGKTHNCNEANCGDTCIWSKLDNAMTKILSETSLQDFINNGKRI